MKKQTLKLVLAVCVLIAVAFTATTLAHEDEHEQEPTKPKTIQTDQDKKKKEAAREKIEEVKKTAEVRKAKIKKDVCENRREHLEAKVPRLSNNSVKLLAVFDKVNDRIQNFYESAQLSVTNFEQLKSAVDAAQAEAEAAVEAAKSYEVQLDCESSSVGEQLDGFRQAVKEAKQALKEYREALVALISAMKVDAQGESNE